MRKNEVGEGKVDGPKNWILESDDASFLRIPTGGANGAIGRVFGRRGVDVRSTQRCRNGSPHVTGADRPTSTYTDGESANRRSVAPVWAPTWREFGDRPEFSADFTPSWANKPPTMYFATPLRR